MSKRDNSSVPQTCPVIDKVISFIESLDYEDLSTQSIKDAVNYMEEIRRMNSDLRDWGNDEYARAEENEAEKDDLEYKYKSLLDEMDDLRKERDEMEEAIGGKDNEIDELIEELASYKINV